jgi:hypothetical protein
MVLDHTGRGDKRDRNRTGKKKVCSIQSEAGKIAYLDFEDSFGNLLRIPIYEELAKRMRFQPY